MCDVCVEEGEDWKFKNGARGLVVDRFYRIYEGEFIAVKLCYLHSLELFLIGESRFLKDHPEFAISVHNKSKKKSDALDLF